VIESGKNGIGYTKVDKFISGYSCWYLMGYVSSDIFFGSGYIAGDIGFIGKMDVIFWLQKTGNREYCPNLMGLDVSERLVD